MNKQVISVHELIESVFLGGNLNLSRVGESRLLQGAEGHRRIQKKRQGKWQNEVSLRYEVSEFHIQDGCGKENSSSIINEVTVGKPLQIIIQGRIDGVLITEKVTIIEEIKTFLSSTSINPINLHEYFDQDFWLEHTEILQNYQVKFWGLSFLHWAQVLIYGYLYSQIHNQNNIICRLNYVKINTELETIFDVLCEEKFLQLFFFYTLSKYLSLFAEINSIKLTARNSLQFLAFPYPFRVEQRKMAVMVYKSIRNNTNLFTRAPTGTGKTLASIFPALKALGEGKTDKIFYLTAKTVGRNVAEKSMQLLQENGALVRFCVITAKEKACLKEFPLCDPEYCEFAVDYYHKQTKAFSSSLGYYNWNFETIQKISQEFILCPFEFSLFLSQHAEIVICDYNYAFEPNVYIRRHFDEIIYHYTFLVDESHNLPERAREMYSKEIASIALQEWILSFPNKRLVIMRKLVELDLLCRNMEPRDKSFLVLEKFPCAILSLVELIIVLIEKQLEKKNKPFLKYYLIKIYFNLIFLVNCVRSIGKEHIVYYSRDNTQVLNSVPIDSQEITRENSSLYRTKSNLNFLSKNGEKYLLKVFCLNPRELFAEYVKFAKSVTYFSATLHPFSYFCEILAGKDTDRRLSLLPSFPSKNFGLFIYTGINTRYQVRENSYQTIADLIIKINNINEGNYLVYFPSFSFLQAVYNFIPIENTKKVVCQTNKMTERERQDFLALFDDATSSVIAFAVMGGIFGEGIDLVGTKLIGSIIITVGLPSLGGEKEIIKEYYDALNHQGFDYAYRLPGFNKVMQAAGRVIRSEEDRGIVVLIDQRFGLDEYLKLYPIDWEHYLLMNQEEELLDGIKKFWERGFCE